MLRALPALPDLHVTWLLLYSACRGASTCSAAPCPRPTESHLPQDVSALFSRAMPRWSKPNKARKHRSRTQFPSVRTSRCAMNLLTTPLDCGGTAGNTSAVSTATRTPPHRGDAGRGRGVRRLARAQHPQKRASKRTNWAAPSLQGFRAGTTNPRASRRVAPCCIGRVMGRRAWPHVTPGHGLCAGVTMLLVAPQPRVLPSLRGQYLQRIGAGVNGNVSSQLYLL